jgi:hypothetical protein
VNPQALPRFACRCQCRGRRIPTPPRRCRGPGARRRHGPLRWRVGWRGSKLLLPRLPKKQQREREHQEQDQTLSVHEGTRQLRDRIMSTRVPRMTTRKAREDKPRTPRGAVAFERLQSVCGAGRVETAVHTEQRAQTVAITPDQKRQQFAHDDPTRQRSTSANTTVPTVKRIRISRLPRRACWARNNSRNRRFIRLRSTARGKTRLGTMRPSLGTPSRFALNSTLNPGRLSARPPESNDAISAAPSRCLRP